MKIGILTLANQLNYGGVLQAYALQRVLRSKGYIAETLDFWVSWRNILLCGVYRNPAISLLEKLRFFPKVFWWWYRGFFIGEWVRRNRTVCFLKERMVFSPKAYKTITDIDGISGYDCIVVGSDQVWNTYNGNPNPFLLQHLDGRIRKVAYAPSFGFKHLGESRIFEYKNALKDFDFISCREKEGCSFIKELTGRDASLVLDPSLLLTREEWEETVPLPEQNVPRYLFCYWLGDVDLIIPKLNKLSKKLGMPYRLYVDGCIAWGRWRMWPGILKSIKLGRGEIVRSAGPVEFLAGLRDAQYILSNSFHAMMFSITFDKKFTIVTGDTSTRDEMNARMLNFAAKYQCLDTLVSNINDLENVVFRRCPEEMARLIEEDREVSLGYLFKSLI